MSIVGKIDCNGPAQVFGRIEGELRASDLLIGEGATIDGSVLAQNVTVCGHVKAVEGDIFHRSLSIERSTHRHRSTRIRDLCE
jgi:cytoskeletal protein CcmA (bactofilin family)